MNRNWERFGEEIRKTVQEAVENQDYTRLNQAITDTINQAADAVANSVKNAANYSHAKYQEYKEETTKQRAVIPYVTNPPSRVMALVTLIAGYGFAGLQLAFSLLGAVGSMLLDPFSMDLGVIPGTFGGISALLAAVGAVIGTMGLRKLFRINRFKKYVAAIGKREYCNVSELASRVGKTSKNVIKDIEYMIRKGWFLEGHLDRQKTCLMITDQMYNQYCQLEQQRENQEKEAKRAEAEKQKLRKEQPVSGKKLAPEVQKVIEQGDQYVRKIRACNDDIPGEEISEKIYRIEMLVDKIFDRVEENPHCIPDIRKLMDYYLPTTVKLLEAYAEMDAQPVAGENIQNAKKEIEATLDTLNAAFEKILDSLFEETAWDVSTDISVLNTLLAQEGLKEDGLNRK